MSTPGIPGQPDYCTFWSAVHSGSEKAAAVLRAFNRHKNGIVEAVAGHIARWEGAPPEWATKYMAVLPVAA
jgi:hypothetical protein